MSLFFLHSFGSFKKKKLKKQYALQTISNISLSFLSLVTCILAFITVYNEIAFNKIKKQAKISPFFWSIPLHFSKMSPHLSLWDILYCGHSTYFLDSFFYSLTTMLLCSTIISCSLLAILLEFTFVCIILIAYLKWWWFSSLCLIPAADST